MRHPQLKGLRHVRVRDPPTRSRFWRWHSEGEGCICTAEGECFASFCVVFVVIDVVIVVVVVALDIVVELTVGDCHRQADRPVLRCGQYVKFLRLLTYLTSFNSRF